MRTILSTIALPTLVFLTGCSTQLQNVQSTTLRVDGDCPMCEKTIEKVAFVKREAEVDWDVDAKTARITIDSTRTTVDAVLQRIANAGYDSERFLAPDTAYAALPGCCQYVRTHKLPLSKPHAQQDSIHIGPPVADEPVNPKSDQFNGLFTTYFALKDALVATDPQTAAVHAGALAAAVKAVQMERMGPDLHGVWMVVMDPLANISTGIAAKTDIDMQRKAFAELSTPLLALVKVAPRPVPIYHDHCPMYQGGADWLSQEKAIMNPFYGSTMLTCGSVKEIIAK